MCNIFYSELGYLVWNYVLHINLVGLFNSKSARLFPGAFALLSSIHFFFHTDGASRISRGYISSLPKSITHISTKRVKGENIKYPSAAVTRLMLGPMFDIQESAAVRHTENSCPSKETIKVVARMMRKYSQK